MGSLAPLPRKFKGVIVVTTILLALFALSAVFGSRGVVDLQRLHRQQAQAEAIVFDLTTRIEQLRRHLDRLEHDDAYLERLARERLNWIKPGELVYRIDRPRRPAAGTDAPEN